MSMTSSEVQRQLTPFEFVPGRFVGWKVLERLLPDPETALFFAKAYKMRYLELSAMLSTLFRSTVVDALMSGDHSESLQDYIVDTVPPHVYAEVASTTTFTQPKAEILPHMWDFIELEVADSIAKVADKLGNVLDSLPSKQGQMTFRHMMQLNAQRPTVGRYGAVISHQRLPSVLTILDVSGSMTEPTIRTIVDDVVAMSWKANASLAIVSNDAFLWDAGTYGVDDILGKAQYGGTYYESLASILDQDWGTVITIADYDSSRSAQQFIKANSSGRIGRVLDLSLVDRPTFLAEVVGQLADEVEPLLVAKRNLTHNWY